MAEKNQGETGAQFLGLLKNFDSYVKTLLDTTVPAMKDPEDRAICDALSKTAQHISASFAADAAELYKRQDAEIQVRFDTATRRLGGNVLIENMMATAKRMPVKRSGFWNKFYEIIEAIKKIIKDIMSVSLFGISLNDVIGLALDIDQIFRVLDNILQTIAGLFGGSKLREQMYETESRNIDMEMKVVQLQKLKYGTRAP